MKHLQTGRTLAEIGALIGDPARANILLALMGGPALSAGELAAVAGVTAQTTSGHLARLVDGGVIAVERQGRHRYYRLATPAIADMLETLATAVAMGPVRHRPIGPRDQRLRFARSCYDHLAGQLGVALADALVHLGVVTMADGTGAVTPSGQRFLCDFGVDLASRSARPLCRTCLDWSERRPHLAGRVGAALLTACLDRGWLVRGRDARVLEVTPAGHAGLKARFGLDVHALRASGQGENDRSVAQHGSDDASRAGRAQLG